MAKNYDDITLALAGICQAARLVQQLAHEGQADNDAVDVMIQSIINNNPSSVADVYGNNPQNLRIGLEAFAGMFNMTGTQGINTEITRYMLGIMLLERRLYKTPGAMNDLGKRIDNLEHQRDHFGLSQEAMLNTIAGIYVDNISPLGPRIQVTGSPEILRNTLVQAKVRSLLLSGIRSAVLWRQTGGNRLQLLFSRSRLVDTAKKILAQH
ncbi:MAG: high frequency lysogenization protein HflD [Morganella sp. (in: enterobacteria)]|uniref:High frequency lysogenization protein HflD homolog n=1 Tax=Morganella psychrotolerans TaxID=368603 RepID=A0A1B8H0B0_9GAMM|nr:high frequency lysogenization protein HflD [Morganella psychrotolerans]OBU02506.1 lysogenization protein HflD [Morganella psychrotolerans]OBU07652.1 lysogenization protein HflD [Morganella psychrotolerans]